MAAPYLTNQVPAPSSTDHPSNVPLLVGVIDDDDDLDSSTVEIIIDGTVAWTSEAPATGFTGYKYAVSSGYRYVLFRQTEYTAGTHTVQVTAEDALSNTLDDSYTFGTVTSASTCTPALWGQFNWGSVVWGCAGTTSVVETDTEEVSNAYLVGVSFPLHFLPNSDIILDLNESVLNNDIRLAVFVRPFGIPLFPLGVGVEDYLFDPLDEVLEAELEVHISDGLSNSVDGIIVNKDFYFNQNENALQVGVPYTNTRVQKNQNSVIVLDRQKVD